MPGSLAPGARRLLHLLVLPVLHSPVLPGHLLQFLRRVHLLVARVVDVSVPLRPPQNLLGLLLLVLLLLLLLSGLLLHVFHFLLDLFLFRINHRF